MRLLSISALLPWHWSRAEAGFAPPVSRHASRPGLFDDAPAGRPRPGDAFVPDLSSGDGPPDQVIYLAGRLSDALARIGQLRAFGVEVLLGLSQGVPPQAAVIVDAESFDDAGKVEHCLDLLRDEGRGGHVLVLYGDRSLVVALDDGPALRHAYLPALQQLNWLRRTLASPAVPREGNPTRPIRRSG